jgi:hypothetical protein
MKTLSRCHNVAALKGVLSDVISWSVVEAAAKRKIMRNGCGAAVRIQLLHQCQRWRARSLAFLRGGALCLFRYSCDVKLPIVCNCAAKNVAVAEDQRCLRLALAAALVRLFFRRVRLQRRLDNLIFPSPLALFPHYVIGFQYASVPQSRCSQS